MKVSILTYHWEDNYGATMQAYATYRAVQELGHNPEFIDLRLPYCLTIKQRVVLSLKRFRFNRFRKKYFRNLSSKTYWSVDELKADPPSSDCYLVGSDQTWNPNIGKALLPAFFLTFGNDKVRRVTYATSIGQNDWRGSDYISDDEIKSALNRFDKILLREDSAIDICKNVFGYNAKQVVDPVLLFKSYDELTGNLKPSGEVIVYKLINDSTFDLMAKSLADEMKRPIRSIGSPRRHKGFRNSYPESVNGWIRRLAQAELVLTDSFHGTVFSLLYHRPFVVYVGNPSRMTRIVSLLEQLNLSDRIITNKNSYDEFKTLSKKEIDWTHVDLRLANMRKESMDLLRDALK